MPTVYILKCKNNCYYIGKTHGSYFQDIDNHFQGKGCEWTQEHKPIRVEILRHFCDETDDDFFTRLYITRYGLDKVRGGSYSELRLSQQQIFELSHYPIDTHITCCKCFMKGHKGHLCPFIRNSFEKKHSNEDIIVDTEEQDVDINTEEPFHLEPENNNRIFTKIVKLFTYPIKLLLKKLYSHKLNNLMSLRLGRSGSVHKIFPNEK